MECAWTRVNGMKEGGNFEANLSALRTFVRFALVWFCLFPLPLVPFGVWEGLRFVIVALPGLFSYFLFGNAVKITNRK